MRGAAARNRRDFGDQRIYASGTAIMFSRRTTLLRAAEEEFPVCVPRACAAPRAPRRTQVGVELVNIIHITHRTGGVAVRRLAAGSLRSP